MKHRLHIDFINGNFFEIVVKEIGDGSIEKYTDHIDQAFNHSQVLNLNKINTDFKNEIEVVSKSSRTDRIVVCNVIAYHFSGILK